MSNQEKIKELEHKARDLCVGIAMHALIARPYLQSFNESVVKVKSSDLDKLRETMHELAKLDPYYHFCFLNP